jgi:DNA-binding beta-propeller fold protein YncE
MRRYPFALTLLLPLLLAACEENPSGPAGADTFTLVAEIDVGSEPVDVEVAGDYYAVANYINDVVGAPNSIMLIDAVTLVMVDTVDVYGNPKDLLYLPATGQLWANDDANRKITAYSVPGLEEVNAVYAPGIGDWDWSSYPAGLVYDSDGGGRIWTADMRSGLVFVFGAAGGAPIDTIRYRLEREGSWSFETGPSVAVDPGRDRLFVGNLDDGRIDVIDTATRTVVDTLLFPTTYRPNFVVADPVNGQFFTNQRESSFYVGKLRVYDSDTLEPVREVDIREYPNEGGIEWVALGSRLVLATGTHLVEYSVPDFTKQVDLDLGTSAARVAYDATRQRYVVSIRGQDVVRVYRIAD